MPLISDPSFHALPLVPLPGHLLATKRFTLLFSRSVHAGADYIAEFLGSRGWVQSLTNVLFHHPLDGAYACVLPLNVDYVRLQIQSTCNLRHTSADHLVSGQRGSTIILCTLDGSR